jgi:hypothetical protein
MGDEENPSPLFLEPSNRRKGCIHAGRIDDLALLIQRDVEVDTNEKTLSL